MAWILAMKTSIEISDHANRNSSHLVGAIPGRHVP